MKILAINGSPHSDGSTAKMLNYILEGMHSAGASTEKINLGELKINHCIGCFNCWTKTPGKCIHQDAMAPLLEKYLNADFIIWGTPLYCFTVTGLMKDFIDRTISLVSPFMKKTESNITTHAACPANKKKKMLLVSPCGFPEFDHFEPLVHYVKYLSDRFGGEYLGEILRPAAAMLKFDNINPKITEYFDNLKFAGKQLIINGKIDKELHDALHKLFISPEECRIQANKHFEKEIHDNNRDK